MNQVINSPGTLQDAAAIFSALRGDQVIALLSRLETEDVQLLLATAAKTHSDSDSLARAASLLASQLKPSDLDQPDDETEREPASHLQFLFNLTDEDIRLLLTRVNTACWAPALHSEPASIRELVFNNVAPAIQLILRDEIAAFDGNITVARRSREQIIQAAKDVYGAGEEAVRRLAG